MKAIIIKICMVTTHMLKIYFKIILTQYVKTTARDLFLLQRI